MAVHAEVHEVPAADGELRIESRALRDIADARIAAMRLPAEHLEPATRRVELAEDHPDQRRLPRAVRTQDRGERARWDDKRAPRPDWMRAVACSQILRDDCGAVQRFDDRAASRLLSCLSCHSWNVAFAGKSVSDTPTRGM